MRVRFELVATTGGRCGARRCLALAVLLSLAATRLAAAQAPEPTPVVREEGGVYSVAAEFSAPGSPATVLSTLADYENIPRFMPAVKTSRVVERRDGRVVVEQEAVASFMLFSRRIHLALEVSEQPGTIRFTDRCGRSFERYDGTWTVSERDGRTWIAYHLIAKPSFDVPPFLLKRLLKRDALQMIEHLLKEISARGVGR